MFKAFSNIILASVMVLLTTGVSVTQHFCHNTLQNTGIFTLAESCREVKSCCNAIETAHCQADQAQQDDDCCKNENVLIKFLSQFTVSKSEQITVFVPEAALFEIFSFENYPAPNRVTVFLKNPPFQPQNIRVLLSTFLI